MVIQRPLRRNPIPMGSRGVETTPVHGFPVRWCSAGLEWYPYLPAVSSFHYPIFRGMNTSPHIVHETAGYVVEPSVVAHWSTVEQAMFKTIESLREHRMTTPTHQPPSYPSQHGYRWKHPRSRNARDAVRKSLCAFQQTLAYCSYSAAGTEHPVHGQYKPFYQQPSLVEGIVGLPADGEGDLSHTLHKLLWATVGEVRQTRNFIGAAISYTEPFDYEFLSEMVNYGVPVYVSWSNRHRAHSYSPHPLNDLLSQWYPPPEAFSSLDSLPGRLYGSSPSSQQTSRHLSTPIILHKSSQQYPREYVQQRKDQIALKLSRRCSSNQLFLARAESAKSFTQPGRRGASVYQFERVQVFDKGVGSVTESWARIELTRANVEALWSHAKRRNLW